MHPRWIEQPQSRAAALRTAAWALYGSDAADGVTQTFTRRGETIPDGQLVVAVRNEYGQSFRPKAIPVATHHPFLTDANGNYVDETGALVDSASTPVIKPD